MSASTDPQPDRMPDWHEPFAEPRTIPHGWDFSGLSADAPGAPNPPPTPPARARRAAWPAWLGSLLSASHN